MRVCGVGVGGGGGEMIIYPWNRKCDSEYRDFEMDEPDCLDNTASYSKAVLGQMHNFSVVYSYN